jgi:uncharacterized membrane protein
MSALKRLLHLSLFTAVLVLSLMPVTWALAQEGKVELSLWLVPGRYYDELTPGEENTLFLEVRNTGNRTITGISLDSDAPEGWQVEFQPASIAYLDAGSVQTVDVNVVPPLSASRGDYNIALIAKANETRAVTNMYARVSGGTSFWLWVGIGVGLLVILVFVIIYLRFGRGER